MGIGFLGDEEQHNFPPDDLPDVRDVDFEGYFPIRLDALLRETDLAVFELGIGKAVSKGEANRLIGRFVEAVTNVNRFLVQGAVEGAWIELGRRHVFVGKGPRFGQASRRIDPSHQDIVESLHPGLAGKIRQENGPGPVGKRKFDRRAGDHDEADILVNFVNGIEKLALFFREFHVLPVIAFAFREKRQSQEKKNLLALLGQCDRLVFKLLAI